MKILHIFNSEPRKEVLDLVDAQSKKEQISIVKLYDGEVDYDSIVRQIAENDKVVSWNNINGNDA